MNKIEKQNRVMKLADQIYGFNAVWHEGEQRGMCDMEGGSEWRHALARFVLWTDSRRESWLRLNERGQRLVDIHCTGSVFTD